MKARSIARPSRPLVIDYGSRALSITELSKEPKKPGPKPALRAKPVTRGRILRRRRRTGREQPLYLVVEGPRAGELLTRDELDELADELGVELVYQPA